MGFDAGQNYGITGILDIGTTSTAKMIVTVRGFGASFSPKVHDITGPGSAYHSRFYSSNVGGGGEFTGEAKPDLCPFPQTFHNLQGSLTLQYAGTTSVIAFPCLISGETVTRNEKTENLWRVSGTWQKNGPYSLANWSGTISYTQPTLLLQETFAGTSKTYDPNSLTDAAVETWFLPVNGSLNSDLNTAVANFTSSAVAPITGLKLNTLTADRLDDGAALLRVQWSVRDSEDNLLFPTTRSRRSAMQGYTDSVGSLVASSGTIANQLNTLYQSFTAESYSWAATLAPYSDGKRLYIREYRNPGVEERISARGNRWIEARVSAGNVQVYVSQNIAGGTGYRVLRFARQKVQARKVRSFIILRNLNSPVVPEDSGSSINGVTLPDIGKTNNASFQGIPAGQCIYDGPHMTVHLGMPGITSFPMLAGWRFRSDSLGIIDGVPSDLFSREWRVATSYTGSGWTNVSTLAVEPFISIVQPTSASFAAFLA